MKVAKYRFKNFYEVLETNAERFPKRPIIFEGSSKLSNLELKELVDSFARYLNLIGVGKGDKVAILLGNCKEYLISFLAAGKLGAVPVPVNTFLKSSELAYILEHSEAKVLITEPKFRDAIEGVPTASRPAKTVWVGGMPVSGDSNLPFEEGLSIKDGKGLEDRAELEDTAVILYTSGTTGKPKGVMLSYKNLFSNIENIVAVGNLSHRDRFIVYLPMFHTFTLTATVLLPLYLASPMVIVKSIRPFSNIFKQVLLKRVSVFMGVPEVYNALAKAKLPWYFMWFNRIRYFISGGAPLPKATFEKMQAKFKRAKLLEGYGLSECSPVVCVNRPQKIKALSVGPPLPDYEVKVVDEELVELPTKNVGEIIVRGDCVMQGYYKNPYETENTIINGWLKTGDMGYLDEEGYLYIVDRKKDLIIYKGINVYPREIEEHLNAHPKVEISAVVGKKDEQHGEVPVAFIKKAQEEEHLDIAELRAYLRERLADYKIPKQFVILKEMPLNATGKVLKRVLRDRLNAGEWKT